MLKNKMKVNKERPGAVLVFVLLIFLVLVIFASTVASIFSSNLKMAKNQEDNMRAYYLVHSGIDITLSTLLNPLETEDGVEKSIIDKIKKENIDKLKDSIEIEGKIVEIVVDYKKDENEMTIKSSTLLDSGGSKELSLVLEFSGGKIKTRWSR